MKPILLLDVDGVLNVPRRQKTLRPLRLEYKPTHRITFHPTSRTVRFMRLAWALFDVRWLTAWREMANAIARHYRLNERPVINYKASKARAAASAMRDFRGRVAWIEDGVDDEARALIAERGWTYFHCDPFVGVTGEHMRALRDFIERPS